MEQHVSAAREPRFYPLFSIRVQCEAPILTGKQNGETLRVIPIASGRFNGERMNGDVMQAGSDWSSGRQRGMNSRVNTQYVLKTDDGAVIHLSTSGVMKLNAKGAMAMMQDKADAALQYYFRQHLYFETDDARYDWLNGAAAFGIVALGKNSQIYYRAYIAE